jgi:hypothetical protein
MNYGTPPCERQTDRECASLDVGIRSPRILTVGFRLLVDWPIGHLSTPVSTLDRN